MLRQDEPGVGRVAPPPALPNRNVVAWNGHEPRRVRQLQWKLYDLGWTLLICVIAVDVGFLVGHY
jgi:hypothetical protein